MIKNDQAVGNEMDVFYVTDECPNYAPAFFSRSIMYEPKFWNIDTEIVGKHEDGKDKFRKMTMIVFSESVLIKDGEVYIGDFNLIIYRGGEIEIKYRTEPLDDVDKKLANIVN